MLEDLKSQLSAAFDTFSKLRQAAASVKIAARTDSLKSSASYHVYRVKGDGNCLFRAIAQGEAMLRQGADEPTLSEEEEGERGLAIRTACVAMMRERRSELEQLIQEDEISGGWDHYLNQMSRLGTWGGEPELSVLPSVINMPIHVVQDTSIDDLADPKKRLVIKYEPDASSSSSSSSPPVRILFNGRDHYDLIYRKET